MDSASIANVMSTSPASGWPLISCAVPVNLINGGTPACEALACGPGASCCANAGAPLNRQKVISVIRHARTEIWLDVFHFQFLCP